MEVQRGTDGDTPSSTITLIPKFKASSHLLWLYSPVVSDLAGASLGLIRESRADMGVSG